MDGVGEDPAVKALVDGTFEKASNLNALDISLMLQQIVRGQTSILHNQDQQAQELAKLREKMDRYDKDAEKWEKDKEKFIDEVNKRAEEFRIDDPNKKAQLIAQEAQRSRRQSLLPEQRTLSVLYNLNLSWLLNQKKLLSLLVCLLLSMTTEYRGLSW
jgi:hypothetical protein